jgi:hypothetical protein
VNAPTTELQVGPFAEMLAQDLVKLPVVPGSFIRCSRPGDWEVLMFLQHRNGTRQRLLLDWRRGCRFAIADGVVLRVVPSQFQYWANLFFSST